MKYSTLFLLLACFAFSSCEENEFEAPEGMPESEEMVDIIYELHITDAISKTRDFVPSEYRGTSVDSVRRILSDSLYARVLAKHQISDSILALSLIHYSTDLGEYEDIYDQVVERISNVKRYEEVQDSILNADPLMIDFDNPIFDDSISYPAPRLCGRWGIEEPDSTAIPTDSIPLPTDSIAGDHPTQLIKDEDNGALSPR